MAVLVLLSLALFVTACEASDAVIDDEERDTPVAPGTSCFGVPEAEVAAFCGPALVCRNGDVCAAPQGAPCAADADCGEAGACFAEEGVCRYDQQRECPDPQWLRPPRCVDWDPQECPCLAGEVAFHEEEAGGRLSCSGAVGFRSDRVILEQTGCHFEARGGEVVGDVVGFGEVRLRLGELPDDTTCSAMADRWIDNAGDAGSPAVRITCSATCKFWVEQFLPLVPEQLVPSGTFPMGTPLEALPAGVANEAPEHPVETSCFFMDAFEVSRREYAECLEVGRCENPDYASAGVGKPTFFSPANALLPITFVSHRMAEEYCGFRGKAVPTEADWERAARGEATAMTTYPWGEEPPDCTRGNFAGCGDRMLPTTDGGGGPRRDVDDPAPGVEPPGAPAAAAIGSAGASHYGVYDLAGNVREWTQDYYVARAYVARRLDTPNRNPAVLEPGRDGRRRAVRGGSYLTPADGRQLQASARDSLDETAVAADLGFRCVRYGTRAP